MSYSRLIHYVGIFFYFVFIHTNNTNTSLFHFAQLFSTIFENVLCNDNVAKRDNKLYKLLVKEKK